MLAAHFLGLLFPALLPVFSLVVALVFDRGVTAVKEAVQKGKGGGLAVLFLLHPLLVAGGEVCQTFKACHGLGHFTGEVFQVLVGNAHALHHFIHLREAQLLGTLEAKALIFELSAVHAGDEHHRNIFLTS